MKIFVFGNPEFVADSLPLKILPKLRELFPEIEFLTLDPNEEWVAANEIFAIDSVQGIKSPCVFDDITLFSQNPRFTAHDFDALSNLRLLRKLGRIKKIKIIGLPPNMSEKEAIEAVDAILLSNQFSKNA